MATKSGRAAGKRDARNKARREQRATKREQRAAMGPVKVEIHVPKDSGAAEGPSQRACDEAPAFIGGGATNPVDHGGIDSDPLRAVRGTPLTEADHRWPRATQFDPRDLADSTDRRIGRTSNSARCDLRIERATDRAVTWINNLDDYTANQITTQLATGGQLYDLVSIQRFERIDR